MKKLTALFFALLFTFLAACQSGAGGPQTEETPYKKNSALSFMVTYRDGKLHFPQAEWGVSKEDWLKAMGFTEEDWKVVLNKNGYESYSILPFIWFEDMGCPGRMTVEFIEGKFRRVRLILISNPEKFEILDSDKGVYKAVDLTPSVKKLAEQLEKADLPESDAEKMMLPGFQIENDLANISDLWRSDDTYFTAEVSLGEGDAFVASTGATITLTITSDLGMLIGF